MNNKAQKTLNKSFYIAFLSALVLSMSLYIFCKFCKIWQLVILIGFLSGMFVKSPRSGFLASFSGVVSGWFLLLAIQSIRFPIAGSASLLADIIGLGNSMWFLIIILSLLVGGIVAGFSGLAGSYFRCILDRL